MFEAAVLLVSAAAGAVAAVAGFGIGSLLTPLLALQVGTKTAVAAVSVPHLVGTFIRFLRLRAHVDHALLWRFGLTSAAGGLTGALLNARASSPALAIVFGLLLVFAGGAQLSGHAQRWRFHGRVAWLAGAASGLLGGLVGNQGGIRSAAMLGFDLTKRQFVATATATALCVDAARMPVYVATERQEVMAVWLFVLLATSGVALGTLAGERLLARVPERRFRRVVGTTILLLGIVTLVRGRA
ncbi:MAG: sulfite exporter TauE/SafE family protein [Acidobacteria bacterium]|nr:sulfite exporter TauE/SafE family protein [Acidobacteriota bacterium]